MSGGLSSALGVGRCTRLLRRDRRGSAAVEFALLGLPFFAILLVIFQAGMLILSQQSLNAAVDRATRALFTGDFQATASAANGVPAADRLKALMCSGSRVFDCNALKVEVRTAASFSAAAMPQPYDSAKEGWNTQFGSTFKCPDGDQIVTITAAVDVPMYTAFLSSSARTMPGGRQLLVSTAIFRAEPYPHGSC
jgi:Flp pilus assembly protein TadG